jgi:hypothetical protein
MSWKEEWSRSKERKAVECQDFGDKALLFSFFQLLTVMRLTAGLDDRSALTLP